MLYATFFSCGLLKTHSSFVLFVGTVPAGLFVRGQLAGLQSTPALRQDREKSPVYTAPREEEEKRSFER
jgi:hypothetical protein